MYRGLPRWITATIGVSVVVALVGVALPLLVGVAPPLQLRAGPPRAENGSQQARQRAH